MSLKQLSIETEPDNAIISLSEGYRQCYIVEAFATADDTALITSLIKAVSRAFENYTWRQSTQAQYEYRMDKFPDVIQLPKPPCISVDSIEYYTSSSNEVTYASSNYNTVIEDDVCRIEPVSSWPSTYDRIGAVTVTFTCGYDGVVPEDIKVGALMLLKYLFDNRDAVAVSEGRSLDVFELPFGTRQLWGAYSVREFA